MIDDLLSGRLLQLVTGIKLSDSAALN